VEQGLEHDGKAGLKHPVKKPCVGIVAHHAHVELFRPMQGATAMIEVGFQRLIARRRSASDSRSLSAILAERSGARVSQHALRQDFAAA
jgi:hypothetical protein